MLCKVSGNLLHLALITRAHVMFCNAQVLLDCNQHHIRTTISTQEVLQSHNSPEKNKHCMRKCLEIVVTMNLGVVIQSDFTEHLKLKYNIPCRKITAL